MASKFYELLALAGYHHPLHPALTHLPVGLTIGGFLFVALAYLFKLPKYAQTAKHCIVLALLAGPPTILFGYFDWQHFYGGAFIFPIKMKLVLAGILLIFLLLVVLFGFRSKKISGRQMLTHFLSLLIVIGLGFFGGELVYGKKITAPRAPVNDSTESGFVAAGAALFETNCSFCHFTDSADTKVGPGLKGFFKKKTMAFSEWTISDDNIKKQLKTPFKEMPSFGSLTDEEINALTAYLKSI